MNDAYRDDYPTWHRAQVASGDIDPVYPVLERVGEGRGIPLENRVWMVFLHVAFYNPGSTFAAFEICPEPSQVGAAMTRLLELPCGVERRGHRDKRKLADHLLELEETFSDGVAAWVEDVYARGHDDPRAGWVEVEKAVRGLYGNGRWASYKTAEMLQKVTGLDITAPDAGHAFSSGPRRGLEILEPFCPTENNAAAIAVLDFMTEGLAEEIGEPDLAQVETSLCDFYSLSKGSYYLGHDIDGHQEALVDPRVSDFVEADVWEARAASFPEAFLGELGGWTGVRRDLKTVYRDTGLIVNLEALS